MYRQSRSEKLVIIVVMKGWPATAESVFRSFLICSTCFNRMTVKFSQPPFQKVTLRSTYCRPCEVSSKQKLSGPPLETLLDETTIHAQKYLVRINHLGFQMSIATLPVPIVLINSKSPTLNCLDAAPTSLLRGFSAI